MAKRKRKRKAIKSLKARIVEHQAKIEREQAKPFPNEGLIRHWQKEIRTWEETIARIERRLTRHKKRRKG